MKTITLADGKRIVFTNQLKSSLKTQVDKTLEYLNKKRKKGGV